MTRCNNRDVAYKNEKKDYNNYCQWRYIELLIFKLVFCDEWCFSVALCLAAGWFISWAWRWGSERAGEFATLRTLCFLHWLDFLVSFKLNFYKQIGFCLSMHSWVLRVSNTLWVGFLLFPRKLEPKPLRALSDVNTSQFVWIFLFFS